MLFGNKKRKPALVMVADVGTMGIQLVVSTFIGLGMGWYLDKWLGTEPWLLIIFLLLGIVSGFRNMFQQLKIMQRRDEEEERRKHEDCQ